jgi:hypothetical protein
VPPFQPHNIWAFEPKLIWQNSGPAFPLLIEALLYLAYVLVTAGFNPFQQAFFTSSLDDIDEELPPYFDHLCEHDIAWSRREK